MKIFFRPRGGGANWPTPRPNRVNEIKEKMELSHIQQEWFLSKNAPFSANITKMPHFGQKYPLFGENPENAPFRLKIPKMSKIPQFGRKSCILSGNFRNSPCWAKILLFGRKYPFLGENGPFWASISKIPPSWWKYPFLGENTPFRANILKVPHFGRNFENTLLWAKMLLFGRKSQKYPFFGENFENKLFCVKMSLFGWKSWKYPMLGENYENIPFRAKIPKIPYFGRKCPFWGKNFENTQLWAKISKICPFHHSIPHSSFWSQTNLQSNVLSPTPFFILHFGHRHTYKATYWTRLHSSFFILVTYILTKQRIEPGSLAKNI